MNDALFNAPVSRRDALKRSIFFSTALLSPALLRRALAQEATTQFPADGMHLLAMGDFGTGKPGQVKVAKQMAQFAQKLNTPLNSVLALGDNFYVDPSAENFKKLFEEMYSSKDLNCPFHACLGNHDYYPSKSHKEGRGKAQAQLDYSTQHPDSRWKMPAKWYAVELPSAEAPLVKLIFIDTNYFKGALTEDEKVAQEKFVQEELQKPTTAPWIWLAGHHPFFSNGDHGDNKELITRFGPYLKSHAVSLYLSGHDHTLQHIEVDGYNSSFVVSGAAGQDLYNVKRNARSPYTEKTFGFNHLFVTPQSIEVQYIGTDGGRLHAFRRSLDGKVETI